MSDLISRQAAISIPVIPKEHRKCFKDMDDAFETGWNEALSCVNMLPSVEDMGEVSDGYHTFNQLYHQRAVLFATVVNQNKDKAWKSWKHEDGKFCFDKDGEWFIVGVDTPEGSYTYHYEKKYWDMFDCEELDRGKHWDGHTEEDVTRLLSLPPVEPKTVTVGHGEKIKIDEESYEVGYTDGQMASKRPTGEWTKKELEQFLHGVGLKLLEQHSCQYWKRSEETAERIKWLEALEKKLKKALKDMRGE